MKNNNMQDVEKRVRRYWYTDGIAELTSGGMFFLLGLYFGVLGYFEEGSLISVILQVSMILVFIGGAVGVRWLVNTLKSRLTYPRTGYVEYRVNDDDIRKRRWVIVASVMIITAVSIMMVEYIHWLDSIVFITGLIVGVIFIALRGKSSGLKRFFLLGGLAIVLGIVLAYSGFSQIYALTLFYGLLGLAIMISGGLVLRSYLVENPLKLENDNE